MGGADLVLLAANSCGRETAFWTPPRRHEEAVENCSPYACQRTEGLGGKGYKCDADMRTHGRVIQLWLEEDLHEFGFGANLHFNIKGIPMKSIFVRYICRMLIVCMGAFPFSTYAGMVGTNDVVAAVQSQGARDKLRDFVGRTDVRNQLQNMGISATAAQARVSAMTDTEVASIAGRIDSLPAGGMTGWAIAGVVIVIGLIWYYMIK